jgi:hypothetical protein
VHPDHQDRHSPFQAVQEGQHQAVPQCKYQVPTRLPQGQATNQEAEDHIQGIKAEPVYVIGLCWMLWVGVCKHKNRKVLCQILTLRPQRFDVSRFRTCLLNHLSMILLVINDFGGGATYKFLLMVAV